MKTNLLKTAYCCCLLLLFSGGCRKYDDTAVWDELYNQSERLAALEALQTTVNGNIDALQRIVTALESYDYVTGVTSFTEPAPGGYTISFTKSPQVTITNGKDGAKGDTGNTGEKGGKGDKGDTGNTGANGNDGATPAIGVAQYPAESGVYYWTLNGAFLTNDAGDKIPVTGPQGSTGSQGPIGAPGAPGTPGTPGANGVSPTLRINPNNNDWEVCLTGDCDPDSDTGWTPLGVKATGNNGQPGTPGTPGAPGTPGSTPVIGVAEEGGVLYWTIDGAFLEDADGNKIRVTGRDGNDGGDGNDGVSPTLRINPTTNYWEVCVTGDCDPDSDTGWQPLGVKATGEDGQPGDPGTPGATPKVAIGANGNWYICSSGTCTGTPPGDGWEDTHVPATGPQGPIGITPTLRINDATGEWEVCLTGDCDESSDEGWKLTGKIAAPQIGAAEDPDDPDGSGIFYWTVNGEWLLDGNNNKIPVIGPQGPSGPQGPIGITPKLRINAGYWEMCTTGNCGEDDGDWEPMGVKAIGTDGGKGDQGDAIFAKDGITEHDDYVEFTLADEDDNPSNNTKIKVPKYVSLSIEFTPPGEMGNGANKPIDLTLAGYVRSIVAVDVPRGWTIAFDLTGESKKMTVTAPAAGNGYYTASGTATLLVSDGNTQTITAPLKLECSDAYTPPPAPDITFTPPGAFTLGETKPITLNTVTASVESIIAVDVPRGWTVEPNLGGKKITVTPPALDGKYYTATGTVKLLVSDNAARTTIKPLTLSCPAYTPPEKLGITFDQPGGFAGKETKEVGFTTTGDATAIKVLDIPENWMVNTIKSGNAGTFTVSANTCENASGEALVIVSDDAGNTVMRSLKLAVTPLITPPVLNYGDRTLAIIDAEMAVVEYTAGAEITGGTLINAPAGVSGSFTGNTFSVYGTPTAYGTFTYTVTLDNINNCPVSTPGIMEVENCTDCAVWAGYCDGIKYVSNNQSEGSMTWSNANAYCQNKAAGWRLPAVGELQCMCSNKATLPVGYVDNWYRSSTNAGGVYDYVVRFSDCDRNGYRYDNNYYVKCVK